MKLNLSTYEKDNNIKAAIFDPRSQLALSNNKFIKSVHSQVYDKIQNFTNRPLVEIKEKETTSFRKIDQNESDE